MDDIIQALFQQYMNPKPVEVDEMGMGSDGGMGGLAQQLMNAATDVNMRPAFKVTQDFGSGKKGKGASTGLNPGW